MEYLKFIELMEHKKITNNNETLRKTAYQWDLIELENGGMEYVSIEQNIHDVDK